MMLSIVSIAMSVNLYMLETQKDSLKIGYQNGISNYGIAIIWSDLVIYCLTTL
jgi:hypothetical protein